MIVFQYCDQHSFHLRVGLCAPVQAQYRQQIGGRKPLRLYIVRSGSPEIEEEIFLYRVFLAERLIAVVEKRYLIVLIPVLKSLSVERVCLCVYPLMIDRRVIVNIQQSVEQDTPVLTDVRHTVRVVGTGNERRPADVCIILDIVNLAFVYDILRDKAFQVLHPLGRERVKLIQVDEQARRYLKQMVIIVRINHAVAIIILKLRRQQAADKGTLSFPLCTVE